MYNYDVYDGLYNQSVNYSNGFSVWMIISAVVAILGGIFLYILLTNKKFTKEFTGWKEKLVDFLTFKSFFIDTILRASYLIVAIYITLSSFGMISTSFLLFLGYLILGNLVVRLIYEFSLILLTICKNTTEINKKLDKNKKDKDKE